MSDVISASSTPATSDEGGHGGTHNWPESPMSHHVGSPRHHRLYGSGDDSRPTQSRLSQGLAYPFLEPGLLQLPGRWGRDAGRGGVVDRV